jgi:CheY-like chemotaxis protein
MKKSSSYGALDSTAGFPNQSVLEPFLHSFKGSQMGKRSGTSNQRIPMNNMHALIIDDAYVNIEVLGLLLVNMGVNYTGVMSARDIEPVLAKLGQVDLVFLDLEIPNGAPYQKTLDKLRQMPEFEGVPFIAYTVHTEKAEEALRAGFDHFLGKPLKAHQFPGQLRRILNNEKVWDY